jgi:hypothetical protein
VECFVNLMSCLDEEREIVREDAAMGLDWDRKRKLLESAVVAVVMMLCQATPKSGDTTFRQHAKSIYHQQESILYVRYRELS